MRLALHHRSRPRARRAARKPVWLLDLDNTLHDSVAHLMPRINRDMTAFLMRELAVHEEEAAALRVRWWRRYGATLLGLAAHHPRIDLHRFLAESHRFPDMRQLVKRSNNLVDMVRRLPGRRILFTNAPRRYAHDVVRCLGMWPYLDGIVSIEAMRFAGRWQPKPSVAMLKRAVARLRVHPADCVLVEDTAENLVAARQVGLRTVLISGYARRAPATVGTRPRCACTSAGHIIDVHMRSALGLGRVRIRG